MAVSRGFGQFSRRMDAVSGRLAQNVEQEIRAAAIAADEALVLVTPVDTGRARSNWIASIGAPVRDEREPTSAGDTIAEARRVIETWRIGAGSIFISNSVPYIIELDNGSSAQAPAGMSRAAIQAARARASRARLLRGLR